MKDVEEDLIVIIHKILPLHFEKIISNQLTNYYNHEHNQFAKFTTNSVNNSCLFGNLENLFPFQTVFFFCSHLFSHLLRPVSCETTMDSMMTTEETAELMALEELANTVREAGIFLELFLLFFSLNDLL